MGRFELTEQRIRAHACLLGVSLWIGAAILLSSPGVMARNGHPKGEDFVHFWTMGRLVSEGRAAQLYDASAYDSLVSRELPEARDSHYLPVYPPQVALIFWPLSHLPYLSAWLAWAALTVAVYGWCVWLTWRRCRFLKQHARITMLLAAAFPPFWLLVLNGQTSVVALAAFVLLWRSIDDDHPFWGGLALSVVFSKPQLGLAAALIFLLVGQWRIVAGAALGIAIQLTVAWLTFGTPVVRDYVQVALALPTAGGVIEPSLFNMHSFRSLFLLLLPWRSAAELAYLSLTLVYLGLGVTTWRSSLPLGVKMAQLLVITTLISPHLYAHNLVVLAPSFLLIEDWLRSPQSPPLVGRYHRLLYAVFALPLFGPAAQLTRVQLSVIASAVLSWHLFREARATLR